MTRQNHDPHLSTGLMQGFLDGEVSPRESERVRSHTASCARCRSELEAWRTLFADLGALEEVGPSPETALLADEIRRRSVPPFRS